jgi:hypothetical protein
MTKNLFIAMCMCLGSSFARFWDGDELCHVYLLMAVVCFNGMNIVRAIETKTNNEK